MPTLAQLIKERALLSDNGCLVWNGATTGAGYAEVRRGKKVLLVHREVAAAGLGRPLAPSEVVLHTCDNPPCVRAEHLSVGTQADNIRDAVSKGRYRNGNTGKTHCVHGHAFSLRNTRISSSGKRVCRECERIAQQKQRLKNTLRGGEVVPA